MGQCDPACVRLEPVSNGRGNPDGYKSCTYNSARRSHHSSGSLVLASLEDRDAGGNGHAAYHYSSRNPRPCYGTRNSGSSRTRNA